MEGLDVRTLAFTNVFLGLTLGFGLIAFARMHPAFNGFRHIGLGHLSIAAGFLLIGMRSIVSDWISIVAANTVIIIGVTSMGIGVLNYLAIAYQKFKNLSFVLIGLGLICFYFYSFVQPNINIRIIIISVILATLCLYLANSMRGKKLKVENPFVNVVKYTFVFSGLVFAFRGIWTTQELPIVSFMDAGLVHGASLVVFQIMAVVTSFLMSWSASIRLEKSLEVKAMIDPLTQLYNRRALEELAFKELSRCERIQSPLAVILMDIDHFKQVNDNYGHLSGDEVLTQIARRIENKIRKNDILARYGGEEFIILLPHTHGADALKIAKKLKDIISKDPFPLSKIQRALVLTASFGVTGVSGQTQDWQSIVERADNALYLAKAGGRNQVKGDFSHVKLVDIAEQKKSKTEQRRDDYE